MTGFRFDVALRNGGRLDTETVELDGDPLLGHRLRVKRNGADTAPFTTGITWFHAPGGLSKSGLLTLAETAP